MDMGAGGLLAEIPTRPAPREGKPKVQRAPRVAAVILVAGQSSRMGANKLLADVAGQPMIRRTVAAMRQAADPGQGQEAGQQAAQAQAFQQMLEGLRTGGLRPDAELMEKLSQMAGEEGEGLRQLTAEELAELLENLEQNAQLLAELRDQLQGMPGMPGECEGGLCDGSGEEGEGQGQGDSDQPGQGAPTRGPGEGGPLFGDQKDGVNANKLTPLAAGDLSRAAPGDMVGEAQAEHEIDEQDSPALRSGGAPVRPGDGGGAVWSDTLHPREQDALRRYFE